MGTREEFQASLDVIVKAVTAGGALSSSGKKNPAKLPGSGVAKQPVPAAESDDEDDDESTEKFVAQVEIVKAEQQIVYGIVLQPETVDAQGDVYSKEVIEDTAHSFLARYNKKTRLGLQHNSFKTFEDRFSVVESFIAPMNFAMGTRQVLAGSWIMAVKIHDAKIWKQVKEGKITGFSIGGRSKVQNLKQ